MPDVPRSTPCQPRGPQGLAVVRLPLDALTPDPRNPRAHSDENVDAIEASLVRFGQSEPLIVQAGTRRVIAGNGRLTAMRRLGWSEADVVELPIDDATATALSIAMNRTQEIGDRWNEPVLTDLLQTLKDTGQLDGVGFSPADLDALIAKQSGEYVEDVPPEPMANPVTRTGDLWVLGDHRLLCGDSGSPEDLGPPPRWREDPRRPYRSTVQR